MDADEILNQAERIKSENAINRREDPEYQGPYVQACEFLRTVAGPKSSFFKRAEDVAGYAASYRARLIVSILQSFIDYVNAGLHGKVSVKRQAQIDVISDFLGQAQSLLEQEEIHPAAPIVLVGAALEEFLRNWVEEQNLSIGPKKPSLDSYAKALREAEIITKQDIKDITSWAGVRNHAAHGEWLEVSDRARAKLMLEGVNLFMRQYTRQ